MSNPRPIKLRQVNYDGTTPLLLTTVVIGCLTVLLAAAAVYL